MKNILLTIIFIFLSCSELFGGAPTLTRLNKIENRGTIQVYLTFTTTPQYLINKRNRRVDLVLKNTLLDKKLLYFEPNDKIVKILSQTKSGNSILSFYFRYKPQRIEIVPGNDPNKLILDILLGNKYTTALPEFSAKLKGLTILQRTTKDYSNPLISSLYAKDWTSFFRLYESDIKIELPIQYTMPPFPVIAFLQPNMAANKTLLNDDIYNLAAQKHWSDMFSILLEKIKVEKNPENKKKLALTYGEALSRSKNFSGAYKQFYLLAREYPEENIGQLSNYLLIQLQAQFEDPYLADYEFRQLEKWMSDSNPITPYFTLNQIETALATKQYDRMNRLLKKDSSAYPGWSERVKEIRQADYWYATDKRVKAYVGYFQHDKSEYLKEKTYSLNGYCDTLYDHKHFQDAVRCYESLADNMKGLDQLGMISLRKHLAQLHFSEQSDMISYFARVEDTYPGTEAGFRAALKKADLRLLTLDNWENQAALYYRALGDKAVTRNVREEATFKEALVFNLLGEKEKSVSLLMKFLKDFRLGKLRPTAQALLIDTLPDLLKQLIEEEKYIKALVLAKKNKLLFKRNWIDIRLLADMAEAYHQLGIYRQAAQLYTYLMDFVSADEKEMYFLPLVRVAYDEGNYNLVEDYADQFSFRYPESEYKYKILYIRILSLVDQNMKDQAITLLPDPIPDNPDFRRLAASLYFGKDLYDKSKTALLPLPDDESEPDFDWYYMLAESSYQLGDNLQAKQSFESLKSHTQYGAQARYRLAQLKRITGREEEALKLFQKIADETKSTLWQELAQKELDITKLDHPDN